MITRRTPSAFDPILASELLLRSLDVLDATLERVREGDISVMDDFVVTLKQIRDDLTPPEWQALVTAVVASHPLRRLMHEEPFTRRAFEKPRGYPGDAPLLDLIYRDQPYAGPLSPVGARLHEWAATQPACLSVQWRRNLLAELIDRVAAEHRMPRILSIACGHLREAQRSAAVENGEVEEVVAIDQDPESVAVVQREQSHRHVTAIQSSVRRLLASPLAFGTFDLAYAAGLYDYLGEAVARSLTAAMFSALRPNGQLLIANFAPELRDIGYMEAIMDWKLLFRTEADVLRIGDAVPAAEVASRSVFRDEPGNVVYLVIQKR